MATVYEIITERIIESLSAGIIPWRKPWNTEPAKSLVSGKEYRGVNVLLLASSPFESPWWLTFNQARKLGGMVRQGQRGTPVIFWKIYDDDDDRRRFVLRYYTVFNLAQCQDIPAPPHSPRRPPFNPIETCDNIVRGYADKPRIDHHGRDAAYYLPLLDTIRIPTPDAFDTPAHYYSTLFHELVHSTGAASRLNRKGITDFDAFGSHQYSFEELIAECGAAFLSHEAGILGNTIDNSAAYIANWIGRLKSDPTWIVQAGAQAAKAADRILGTAAHEGADDAAA